MARFLVTNRRNETSGLPLLIISAGTRALEEDTRGTENATQKSRGEPDGINARPVRGF